MRRWEPAKFGELGKLLINGKNAKILIFGGPDEMELKQTVSYKINSPNAFTVETNSLAETAAVMKRCQVFVTNDSSLMHVASALKLNTVALIGPTNTNYIHPWQTNYKIATLNLDCAPCFCYSPKPLTCTRTDVLFKCIKELDVKSVYSKVEEFI
jgi:heptosyltransferase-2